MTELLRGYGRGLVAAFFALAGFWALMMIVLPQLTMLEQAVTLPERQLDSAVAIRLEGDARTCLSILESHETPSEEAPAGALAIPSMSAAPTVPSFSGAASDTSRPFIIQCERTTTRQQLSRDGAEAWLDETYGLPQLAVSEADPLETQMALAEEIATVAEAAQTRILEIESRRAPYTFGNFGQLFAPRLIPLSPEQRAIEDRRVFKQVLGLIGLRLERDGEVYERIALISLLRTISFATLATGLALIICYPIAFKVALATRPERQAWLFLGLIIPYAIAELMRIYAWTIIIDNQGLLNSLLLGTGLVEEAVQFKRFPGTIFVVIVYTYVLFMVFPIVNVMSTLDRNQIEASQDLGAGALRVHWRVIIPHAKPGIAVGCIATFMLATGAFSVPRIISSGLQAEWFTQSIYNRFFEAQNANVGAAYSFAYTVICFLIVAVFMWIMRTRLKDFVRAR